MGQTTLTDDQLETMRDGLRASLGHVVDQLSAAGIARMTGVARIVAERWPDDTDQQDEAMTAAGAVLLGAETLETIAVHWRAAVTVAEQRHAAWVGAVLVSDGSEESLMRRSRTTRGSVRRALGRRVWGRATANAG